MQLPNAGRAFVDLRKLTDYCLNPSHPVGRHKSNVFRRALGLTAEDARRLRDLILRAVVNEVAVAGRADEFGQRYTVDFRAATPVGSAMIRTAWIVLGAEDFPRLTTCFVLAG